jgi:hypothetical protein
MKTDRFLFTKNVIWKTLTSFTFFVGFGSLAGSCQSSLSSARAARDVVSLIIPQPTEAKVYGGTTNLAGAQEQFPALTDSRLEHARSILTEVFGAPKTSNRVHITLTLRTTPLEHPGEYTLKIDRTGANINAPSAAGLFYGAITLASMSGLAGSKRLPHVTIHDTPDLPYRGVMLDVGRNYIPVPQLKRQLDLFARCKINVFHWHLTDDPGWRFEVKSHPELTSASSMELGYAAGRFYTQREIRDIIVYAKARNITVVPEIDIPGHSAALRRALRVARMDDPKVAATLRDAFRELLELARPEDMPLIHIGSDEVRSPEEKMPEMFIDEIAATIQKSGRRVILWSPGMRPPSADERTIEMLWGTGKPNHTNPYIDARALYASTYTGFDAVRTPFWNAPARDGYGQRFGAELALWFDLPNDNVDIERTAPFWPAVLTFAHRAWHGGTFRGDLLVKLPDEGTQEALEAHTFDTAIVANRDAFFHKIAFPYIRDQGYWHLLGPIPNHGNYDEAFGPEKEPARKETSPITVETKTYRWDKTARGAHIFLKQMWNWPGILDESEPEITPWPTSQEERTKTTDTTVYARAILESDQDREVGFWIQIDPPNPSDRRAGPNPPLGQWSRSHAKVWINGTEIEPPRWKTPGLGAKPVWHDPIPITDEFYFTRPAISVKLHKGDNVILLRLPDGGVKWEFVCTPVQWDGVNAREIIGVRFKK